MIRAIEPVPVLNLVYDKTLVPAAAAILSAIRRLTNNNRELVILYKSSTPLIGATLNLQLFESAGEIRYTHHDLIKTPTFGAIFTPEQIDNKDAEDLALAFLLMLGVSIPEVAIC